eukprot:8408452-Alexandrium_andersonii.AAC.1
MCARLSPEASELQRAYTAEFGRAVCAAFFETLPSADEAMGNADCDTDEDTEDEWADAGATPSCRPS